MKHIDADQVIMIEEEDKYYKAAILLNIPALAKELVEKPFSEDELAAELTYHLERMFRLGYTHKK